MHQATRDASHEAADWNARAIALRRSRRYDEALTAFLRALAHRPQDPDIRANLGHLLLETGCIAEALAAYRDALTLAPTAPNAHFNCAAALRAGGHDEAALPFYRTAIALRPDYVAARNNLASALVALGRLDEAAVELRHAIALAPADTRLYHNLVHVRSLPADDPALAALERMAANPAIRDEDMRIHLHLALGKAYADLGRPAAAMDHLQIGNALRRRRVAYDEVATLARFERIEAVFTAALIRACRPVDPDTTMPQPIFVVGMPRSGTSLIEQILASHPAIHGAGELAALPDAVAALGAYPDVVSTLAGTDGLRAIARDYLDRLRRLAPAARFVVDKMPGNFLHLGLIHLALPQARILHVRRDPIDTCMSCFMTLFAHGQDFTYDPAELGRYWRAYDRLMAHWRRVLPAGAILEVDYEAVVEDFDDQVVRMLAFCGLGWDEACRAFHRQARPVRSASAAQVRRPLYRRPRGQWHAYGALLGFDTDTIDRHQHGRRK